MSDDVETAKRAVYFFFGEYNIFFIFKGQPVSFFSFFFLQICWLDVSQIQFYEWLSYFQEQSDTTAYYN